MNEDLRKLLLVQEIDLGIYQLEQEKRDFPKQLNDIKIATTKAQDDCDKIKSKITILEDDKKTSEADAVNEKELLKRSQDRLNSITTNREYDAVHEEIETHMKKIKLADEKTISLMEEIEKTTVELQKATTWLTESIEKNAPEIERLTKEISHIDDKIKTALENKKEACANIPNKLLRTYEKTIKGRKNGRAMGLVYNDKRSCSYCFKSLTLQQASEVRRNEVDTILCDSCGSILVWMDE